MEIDVQLTLPVPSPDELAGAVADKVAERFAAGYPMVLPPGCEQAFRNATNSHGWRSRSSIGPHDAYWSMEHHIRPDGKLYLQLLDPAGQQVWQGTLAEVA